MLNKRLFLVKVNESPEVLTSDASPSLAEGGSLKEEARNSATLHRNCTMKEAATVRGTPWICGHGGRKMGMKTFVEKFGIFK